MFLCHFNQLEDVWNITMVMRCMIAYAGQSARCTMETVLRVNRSRKTRSWNQNANVLDPKQVSHKSQMLSCEPFLTPMTTKQHSSLQEEKLTVSSTHCLRQWPWLTHEAGYALQILCICFMTNQDHKQQRNFTVNLRRTDGLCKLTLLGPSPQCGPFSVPQKERKKTKRRMWSCNCALHLLHSSND